MAECIHVVTQNNCCVDCGKQVWAIETRICGDCKNYKSVLDGGMCERYYCACWKGMRATYSISTGTCFVPKEDK